jgi:hypothetical protein
MPFAAFNNVVQTTPNSCGAFALAAALVHLGRLQVTNVLNTADLAQGFNQPGPQSQAQNIYQVTGCLNLDFVHLNATYRYQAPVADMNPPSALAYMAVRYGTTPGNITINYDDAADQTFSAIAVVNNGGAGDLLNTEIALINSPAYGNVNGNVDYTALPGLNEAHLLLVNNNTHWIVINNNQVYDPGTGYVGAYVVNNPLPLATLTYTLNNVAQVFQFSGLWIRLT